jgi:hypothetical protein
MQSTSKKKIDDLYTAHIYLKEFLKEKGIFKHYQEEYLIKFLVSCVSSSFGNYFKMSSQKRDKELDVFMKSIRKSDFLSKNNLLIVREASKRLDSNEKGAKKQFKMAFLFLVGIKYNYNYTRLINKIIFKLNHFFFQKRKNNNYLKVK